MSAPASATCRVLREFWAWLSGTGYRPERHYMRGGTGRAPHTGGGSITGG